MQFGGRVDSWSMSRISNRHLLNRGRNGSLEERLVARPRIKRGRFQTSWPRYARDAWLSKKRLDTYSSDRDRDWKLSESRWRIREERERKKERKRREEEAGCRPRRKRSNGEP
ncbi:hypothetical protein GE21DRAFT_1116012 [Neurospora crassa]|nr:hypothetical protein GE21DRAFT_1116012 [Neurospora crassa]